MNKKTKYSVAAGLLAVTFAVAAMALNGGEDLSEKYLPASNWMTLD